MVLNNAVWRTIKEQKGQYVGLILIIILACFGFVSFGMLGTNLQTVCDAYAKQTVQEDLQFETMQSLGDLRAIGDAVHATIEESRSYDEVFEGRTLRVFSENHSVNRPALLEGTPLSDGHILIDPQYAKSNTLRIGDPLTVAGKHFEIAGFVALADYTYITKNASDLINDSKSFGVAVITRNDFSANVQADSIRYVVKFLDGSKDVFTQGALLKKYLREHRIGIDYANWSYALNNARINTPVLKTKSVKAFSAVMPIMLLLASCVMIGLIVRRLIKTQAGQIGTLYALGYRKSELIRHYLRYPLVISVVGAVVGTILGIWVYPTLLIYYLAYFPMPIESATLVPGIIAWGLILPFMLLIPFSFFVIWNILKSSPISLMRGEMSVRKPSWLERSLKLGKVSFSLKFMLREQLRSLPQLFFLMVAIAFVTVFLNVGMIIKHSFDALASEGIKSTFDYQYEYLFKQPIQSPVPSGTEPLDVVFVQSDQNKQQQIELIGIQERSSFIHLLDGEGNPLDVDHQDAVILSKSLVKSLHADVGSFITFTETNVTDKSFTLKVTAITTSPTGAQVFVPLATLNQIVGLPFGSYAVLISNYGNVPVSKDQRYTMRSLHESSGNMQNMLQQVMAAVYVMMFVSILIALVLIYVIASITVQENQAQISLMKVFGYRMHEIKSMILNPSGVGVVLGYMLGIPVTLYVTQGVYQQIMDSMNLTMSIQVNGWYFLVGFVLVYGTFECSKLMCISRISRVSMSETLMVGRE